MHLQISLFQQSFYRARGTAGAGSGADAATGGAQGAEESEDATLSDADEAELQELCNRLQTMVGPNHHINSRSPLRRRADGVPSDHPPKWMMPSHHVTRAFPYCANQ